MRSNLLSLQQTAKLQDLTQNRLATGLKVNSAIDNPSSYYTAQSLNNRAEDLNILLDAMSQGIQTLKAVNESIEAGTKFLEQAKSVASSALETAQPVIAKVSTEAELLAAVNSGKKGLIVLTSDITMSTNQNIVLNDGQSLVGARYLDKNAAQTKLKFNFDGEAKSGIITGERALISDLDITFISDKRSGDNGAVFLQNESIIQNTNITLDTSASTDIAGARSLWSSGTAIIKGNVNLRGISNMDRTTAGKFELHNAILNGLTNDFGFSDTSLVLYNSVLNASHLHNAFVLADIDIRDTTSIINVNNDKAFAGVKISAVKGANFAINGKLYTSNAVVENVEISAEDSLPSTFILQANPAPAFPDIVAEMTKPMEKVEQDNNISTADQFNQILTQYDMLINDSWYKGVNLLKSQDLKVVFNESRTSDLDIKGVDATTKGLGLEIADWSSADGVQNSLDQIDSAINQLRLYASEFGNYYQIVTTRENFTNSLINVLTEGADALTLADMNQESANMLALQTRQQLAVNSLSLASQASQSVLKLF